MPNPFRVAALIVAIALLAGCSGSSSTDSSTADQEASLPVADPTTSTVEGSPDSVVQTESSVVVGGGEITVVEVAPSGDAEAQPMAVLFLHGAAYTSQTWVANGILASVAEAGHRSVAIDLPGSGTSDSVDVDEADFLAALLPALELDPATTVVVSPSMSGIFSLPALRTDALADLAGYVPVAPSGASSFADGGPPVDVPALLVWGDGDGNDPQAAAERLGEGFTDAEVLVLADAGHAAYEQQPEAFTDALLTFIASLSP